MQAATFLGSVEGGGLDHIQDGPWLQLRSLDGVFHNRIAAQQGKAHAFLLRLVLSLFGYRKNSEPQHILRDLPRLEYGIVHCLIELMRDRIR